MGRPPKPAEQVRRNRLVVMLTDTEMAALQAWADERGVPQGTLAWEVLARALRRRT
jgi:hypothetical protein